MLSKEDYAKYVKNLRERTQAMMKLESGRKWARLGLQTERMLWLNPRSTSLVRAHPDLRQDMIRAHRQVEFELFGEITELPGERELLKESPDTGTMDSSALTRPTPQSPSVNVDGSNTARDNQQVQTSILAASILDFAVNSAQLIEDAFFGESSDQKRFKDEDFQDVVMEFANLFIHLFLRDAFDDYGPERGGAISNTVAMKVYKLGTMGPMSSEHPIPAFTRKVQPGLTVDGWGWDELQERNGEYGRFPLFVDDSEPLSGTVFWKFGKHICKVCDRYRSEPGIQIQANLFASNASVKLVRIFREYRVPGDGR